MPGESWGNRNVSYWLSSVTGCVFLHSGLVRPGGRKGNRNLSHPLVYIIGFGSCLETLLILMAFSGTGTLVASIVSKMTSSAAMVKAGGAVSGTILAGSKGLILLTQSALGSATSALGALKVGTILSWFPASALAASPIGAKAAVTVLGGAMTVAAVPPALSAVGFTSSGIAASSLAAKMMSLSAIANGGGVPAGGLVAILQSAGAAGLSMPSTVLVGSAGSAVVASAMNICENFYPFLMGSEVADMATEVADMGSEVADMATEVTNMGSEVADMATEVANMGSEVADMGSEVADMASEVADTLTEEALPNLSNTEKD
ncbi:interferon alpha-inducible protein 27-like protein 2B [Mus pahari]|uniref:interferon alpha-inducible protein 27-like protein 2B n=1 Tax=Mus pahari TaxID=10093 RepID=UPI001114AAE5|nr:interferon alpha-inducible protein 27-like protein 2B [Mus pahari]